MTISGISKRPGLSRRGFSPKTARDADSPSSVTRNVVRVWDPASADAFLCGVDWKPPVEQRDLSKPVINLIHALITGSHHFLRQFLPHRALRVCVSPEVAAAVQSYGRKRMPVVTIPNGIDAGTLPSPRAASERDIDLLIVGLKNPLWAAAGRTSLWRGAHALPVDGLLRADFLGLSIGARQSPSASNQRGFTFRH
jgi:hypothetical protein